MDNLKEKLDKILEGCEKCKAKMCHICPNGTLKKRIRAELKEGDNIQETGILAWLKSLLKN